MKSSYQPPRFPPKAFTVTETTTIDPQDLRVLLICALRYAMGRSSYMPDLIRGLIRDHISLFEAHARGQLANEIDEYYRGRASDGALAEADRQGWMLFRDWLLHDARNTCIECDESVETRDDGACEACRCGKCGERNSSVRWCKACEPETWRNK